MKETVIDFFNKKEDNINRELIQPRLIYLICARVLIITLLLITASLEVFNDFNNLNNDKKILFSALGFIFLFSLINSYIVRTTTNLKLVAFFQILFDVLVITFSIYVFDPLVVVSLYLVAILASSLVLTRKQAICISSICGIGYAFIASSSLPGMRNLATSLGTNEILGVYMSMLIVALISSFLSYKLEKTSKLANEVSKNLDQAEHQQKRLLEEVSDGVITLDLQSAILGINEAAKAILGISELSNEQLIGEPLQSTLEKNGITGFKNVLNKDISEIEFKKDNRETLHLNCAIKEISPNDNNAKSARMLVISDQSKLRQTEEKLALHEQLAKTVSKENESSKTFNHNNIIGGSTEMKEVFKVLEKVSVSKASVLITGESGTGKELIARAIHFNSERANKQFIAINCGAIPENLIESELFGHKKGAFTGAISDSLGLFRQANHGTIFLDEIGELPLHLQTKLLRVLQERAVRAVGETRDIKVDVRVIAATNKNLKEEVKKDQFRDDLFYRLNVVNIKLPSLRKRKEDIPALVNYFAKKFSAENTKNESEPIISPEALSLICKYDYPGNIRELENVVERALVLGGNAILPENLPEEFLKTDSKAKNATNTSVTNNGTYSNENTSFQSSFPMDLEKELKDLERHYINSALEHCNGAKQKAAELLGLNFRSFRYRLKKYESEESSEQNA